MNIKKEITQTTVYGSSKTAVLVVWGEGKEKKLNAFTDFISVIDVLPKWVLSDDNALSEGKSKFPLMRLCFLSSLWKKGSAPRHER